MRLKILPKKGDLRDLNNWRGIMLLDAASKVVSMIINSRLQLLLKEVGIEEQNGVMGGRGGSDGIFCIRQALKKRREHGKESWVLFVDLVKAFVLVPRDVLFHSARQVRRATSPGQRYQADEHGPPGELRPQRQARGRAVHGGRQAGMPAQPDLFLFIMHACLESLEKAIPADAELKFRTNTRTEGKNGCHVPGSNYSNKCEFAFSL